MGRPSARATSAASASRSSRRAQRHSSRATSAALDGGTLGVLPSATYRDCDFTEADLSRALPGVARFEGCRFVEARLDGWFTFQAEFLDCTFVGPLRRVRFYGRVEPADVAARVGRRSNEFRGNDFSGADLVDVEFVGGIDLTQQTWPSSPEYRRIDQLPERLEAARHIVEGWPSSAERETALAELRTLTEVYRDQPSMMRRTGTLSESFERLWEAVEGAPVP